MSDTNPAADLADCLPLAQAALRHWGFEGATLRLMKQRENAVFAVEHVNGERHAMRVHRAGYHSKAALQSELEWMRALDAYGVGTPTAIPAKDGTLIFEVSSPEPTGTRHVDMLTWVPGVPIGSVEQGVEDVPEALRNYRIVGALMARMHNFAGQWQAPAAFTRHAWDADGLLGEQPWWGRFWELQALKPEQMTLVLQAREKALADLSSYGASADRYGLIHADLVPDNCMRGPDGAVHVIDFDDGGFGWFLFDFATALFFHLGQDYYDELQNALIEGYMSVRDLPPEFEERLMLFFLMRGFAYLGWGHTRGENETSREMMVPVIEGVMQLVQAYLAEPLTDPQAS